MDRFSLIILERTMELVTEAMQFHSDPRVGNCLTAIQRYIEAPNCGDEKELHDAVKRLLEIARENHEVLIAARLSSISAWLGERSGKIEVA